MARKDTLTEKDIFTDCNGFREVRELKLGVGVSNVWYDFCIQSISVLVLCDINV